MKSDVFYPIITAIVIAGGGLLFSRLGFDFKALFDDYFKETLFIIISVFLFSFISAFDIFRGKLKKAKSMIKRVKEEKNKAVNDSSATRRRLDAILKEQKDLKYIVALKNHQDEDSKL